VVDALSRSMKVIHLAIEITYETYLKERVKGAHEVDEFFNIVKVYLEQEPTGVKYDGY
jgi:hypothetical protein